MSSRPPPGLKGMWVGTSLSLVAMLFPCMCGNLPIEALPFSLFGAVCVWCSALRYPTNSGERKAFVIFVVGLATFIFFKNICDVLWLGHDALLD